MALLRRRRVIGPALSFMSTAATFGTAAWNPLSANAIFWHDADNAASITKDGSNRVSFWNDLTSTGLHAYQTVDIDKFVDTPSVQNGKHGLLSLYSDGAGSSSYMYIPSNSPSTTVPQPFILFMAIKTTTMLSWSSLFDGYGPGASGSRCSMLAKYDDGSGYCGIATASGQDASGGPPLANNTAYYLTGVFDGASSKFRRNGIQLNSTSTIDPTRGLTPIIWMYASWAAGLGFPGYFLEVFLVPGNSTTDVTAAENYLATKWGIT
jgi:hypothetical protein